MLGGALAHRDAREREPGLDGPVVPAYREHEEDENWDGDDDHPGARQELALDDDDRDDAGRQRAEAIDGDSPPPAGLAAPPPSDDHAGLGERERQEDPERVERDERRHARVEHHEQECRQPGEGDDSGREREPFPAEGELARHERVARQERRQAREVREGRVGGQRQDKDRRDLDHDEERALPHHDAGDLREHRVLLRRVGDDADRARHEADAEEESGEDRGCPDERDARVAPLGRSRPNRAR